MENPDEPSQEETGCAWLGIALLLAGLVIFTWLVHTTFFRD